MKTAKQIKGELDQTSQRLNELKQLRDRFETNLKSLHDSFVSGKTPLDMVQNEQSKLDTLNSSIRALEGKQSELQSAFNSQQSTESRQATLNEMKECAGEARAAFNEYLKARELLGEIVREHAESIYKTLMGFRAKQKEFNSNFRRLAPEVPEVSELYRIGIEQEDLTLVRNNDLKLPPVEYGEVVHLTEQIITNQKFKDEQAARHKEREPARLATV